MDEKLKNRTVLLTGGLGDIGRATAEVFAFHGANIALCDILPAQQAADFVRTLEKYSVRVRYHQVDVSQPGQVKEWILTIENELGIADIIIANAAVVTFSTIHDIKPEQWSNELRVNLDGAFYVTQFGTSRLLHHQRAGNVVFVGSWAANTVHTHIPAYCVSKAGVRMLCRCLALELAPHGILVNEVAPGYVDAGLSGRSFEKDPVMKEQATQRVPVKKLITATQVAQQIFYLCDPLNEHITGSTLLMDGGLSLLC